MLEFKKITLADKELLTPYFEKYGEDSCQHSLYLMTGLSMKYGDEYAIYEDVLYVHRSLLDRDNLRVYLAPFGEKSRAKQSLEVLLEDAKIHGAGASFFTVTERYKNLVEEFFPGRFLAEESEDYAEYLYLTDNLKILPGKTLAAKRNRVRAFYSEYDGTVQIEDLSESNIPDVILFQRDWIEAKRLEGVDEMLEREHVAILYYLSHFEELDFKGIVVYVKGTVVGYAAGVLLNKDCIDEVIEKGRKDITGIYQVLCNEFAICCAGDCTWINREEDLGVEGLRKAKKSYQPERMLKKFILTQQ